jgi:REP element-mobilizing transposase RayT
MVNYYTSILLPDPAVSISLYPEIIISFLQPNHLHGIIIVNPVGAIHELPLQRIRRKMLLPQIIRFFKMNSAKQINILFNRSGQSFWQRNYYEHVIRNEKSLNNIRQYIINNPRNWKHDVENPKNKKSWGTVKTHYEELFK